MRKSQRRALGNEVQVRNKVSSLKLQASSRKLQGSSCKVQVARFRGFQKNRYEKRVILGNLRGFCGDFRCF
jgi:hypothetical protein